MLAIYSFSGNDYERRTRITDLPLNQIMFTLNTLYMCITAQSYNAKITLKI